MRTVAEMNEILGILAIASDLTVFLEDWDEGLRVETRLDGQKLVEQLIALRPKYGNRCHFRAFNDSLDVWWNGDFGIVCQGSSDKDTTVELHLESDAKRHPGMLAFGNLTNAGIVATVVRAGDKDVFLRFRRLKENEKSGACTP